MKKILRIAVNGVFSNSVTKGAVLPALAMTMAVAFWSATAPVARAQDTDGSDISKTDKTGKGGSKGGKGGSSGKCDVCHNPHNYHTISIPCDQVDKFLSNHPGDFRGRCEVTGVTNP